MVLEIIDLEFSICKVRDLAPEYLKAEFTFAARTGDEVSLVCQTEFVPSDAIERVDGWRAFRIQGVLDFSLIGVLAPIATVLAGAGIGIFAISTFNTDYILVKSVDFKRACASLVKDGYEIV